MYIVTWFTFDNSSKHIWLKVMKIVIAAESATYVEILHWQKQNLMAFMVEFAIYYAWWHLRGNCNFVVVIFKQGVHSVQLIFSKTLYMQHSYIKYTSIHRFACLHGNVKSFAICKFRISIISDYLFLFLFVVAFFHHHNEIRK